MAVWKRKPQNVIQQTLISSADSCFSPISTTVSVDTVDELLQKRLPDGPAKVLIVEDATYLVDLFTCLFDLPRVGLRLTHIDRAMCPRFHVDSVPCRLVTTYAGSATQWLPNEIVNRQKLGRSNNGHPDHASGLFQLPSDVKQLCGFIW